MSIGEKMRRRRNRQFTKILPPRCLAKTDWRRRTGCGHRSRRFASNVPRGGGRGVFRRTRRLYRLREKAGGIRDQIIRAKGTRHSRLAQRRAGRLPRRHRNAGSQKISGKRCHHTHCSVRRSRSGLAGVERRTAALHQNSSDAVVHTPEISRRRLGVRRRSSAARPNPQANDRKMALPLRNHAKCRHSRLPAETAPFPKHNPRQRTIANSGDVPFLARWLKSGRRCSEHNWTMKTRSFLTPLSSTIFMLLGAVALAQSTWTGGGAPDGNFSNTANWNTPP